MIPRPGLCIGEDGKPQRFDWQILRPRKGFTARKLGPAFFLSPDPTGHMALAYMQGSFFSVALDFHHGRWMTTEQWLHCLRREQLERQKTHPWRYRSEKWDGVKVCVLPRTDPDGLVVDSNTAIVLDRKERMLAGVPSVPGAVVLRGGRPMDCDYDALAHMIGHPAARDCFKRHNRQISS